MPNLASISTTRTGNFWAGSALDPNQMWTEWKTRFLQIVDKHAPTRTKRVRSKNSPWITADLKERMHNRDRLKIKAMKSNDPHDWANFKRMHNKVGSISAALSCQRSTFLPEKRVRGEERGLVSRTAAGNLLHVSLPDIIVYLIHVHYNKDNY